jgi:hypothetical protein
LHEIVTLKGKKSAAEIARIYGFVSRNVVIGVWHRSRGAA